MHVAELWRYPVKSMAGERLQQVVVGPLGLAGDRIVHVQRADGRTVTARTHPLLLGHKGTLGPDGEPRVDGRSWQDPSVGAAVEQIVGVGARLVRDESADRFDVLPLLVVTDGAVKAFGHDGRRLRPNIIVGGVAGLQERTWERRYLRVGKVVIGLEDLRARCVMTTYDPDSLEQDPRVLREIVHRFGARLALNAAVIRMGLVRVGETVELLSRVEALPESDPGAATRPTRPNERRLDHGPP